MANKVIHAEVEARQCTADLYVNGVPIPGVRHRQVFEKFSFPVHHWIVAGKNELTLAVDVDGSPSESLAPRKEKARKNAQAVGRFVEYEEGVIATPSEGRVLAQVSYSGIDDETDDAPRIQSVSADLPVAFGRWAWEDAPVITLDDATIAEAVGVLESIVDALFGGDLARMMDLVKVRWAEVDRAYPGRNDADDRASLGTWLAELASQPHRRTPLRSSLHDFRLVAGGRVIECVDEDYMPSVRIRQEIEPDRWVETPYPVYLARIGNALTVVR
jgi:hypothetical protein